MINPGEASPARVLILSATVGSSHNMMADALRDDVRRFDPDAEVTTLRDFRPLGRGLGAYLDWSFRVHFGRLGWSYDLTYLLFTRSRAAQRFGERSLYRVAGNSLARSVEQHDPDVVIATHPVFNPILAGLRRDGRLKVPAATTCCELGGLEFWLQRALDLHMMIYPEAVAEAQRSLPGVRAQAVRPLLSAEFFEETSTAAVAELLPPGDGPLALVSGGGWGLGDLAGAVEGALAVRDCRVVVVAGQNPHAQAELRRRFASEERVTVLGFSTQMSELLAAADVFVHTTVGLSCLEARLRGCQTICYGLFVGHIRDNAAALARYFYVQLAHDSRELTAAVSRCVHDKPPPELGLHSLPSGGEAALALAGRPMQQSAPADSQEDEQELLGVARGGPDAETAGAGATGAGVAQS